MRNLFRVLAILCLTTPVFAQVPVTGVQGVSLEDLAGSNALVTVILGQVPLMFFMAYVPEEPSVVGMGTLTVALGCGAMAASFLIRSRVSGDE